MLITTNVIQKIFWILFTIASFCIVLLSLNTGINTDDFYQNYYADHLLEFYSSLGKNKSCFTHPKGGPIKYYGGLFEIITAITNKLLGYNVNHFNYHHVRHLWNAVFGITCILYSCLLGQKIYRNTQGWVVAILVLCSLSVAPRFIGHTTMNPKDIPFATGYMISIYYIYQYITHIPKLKISTLIKIAIGIGISLGIRIGGLLCIGYLFLFGSIRLFLAKKQHEHINLIKQLFYLFISSISGIAISLLFWPYALINPLSHLYEAIVLFGKFSTQLHVLFQGKVYLNDALPWQYLLIWISISSPVYLPIGIFCFIIFIRKIIFNLKKDENKVKIKEQPITPRTIGLILILFSIGFPIGIILLKESTLYDGWRHLLFIYPCLSIITSIGLYELFKWSSKNNLRHSVIITLMSSCFIEPLDFIHKNYQYPYLYFNKYYGGIEKAYGNYETDYWGISTRESIGWLKEEKIIYPKMKHKIKIVSNVSYQVDKYIETQYNDRIEVCYVAYHDLRYHEDWDYGIFNTRFIDREYLLKKYFPDKKKTTHTIEIDNTPILAIFKNKLKRLKKIQKTKDWREMKRRFLRFKALEDLENLRRKNKTK